jgi:4-amino-4-deoxy-L-arabinose transferase-like glycosyltransferase
MAARPGGTSSSPGTSRAVTALASAAIALGIGLRLLGVWLIPFGQMVQYRLEGLNDEPAHFAYVEYLATRHALPVQTHSVGEPGAFERADFEYYQPPLYYVIGAALYGALGRDAGLIACRLLSALCGILTLGVMGMVFARCGMPPVAARIGVGFAALLPTHAYFCALVSNDALSWLLAGAILWRLACLAGAGGQDPAPPRALRRGALLAALLAAGVLTKGSLALFLPLTAALYTWESLRSRSARPVMEGLAVVVVACAVAAPWWIRSFQLYGSPFGLEAGFGAPARAPLTAARLYGLVAGTVRYFWFPMQNLGASPWVRIPRLIGAAAIALHAAAWLMTIGRRGLSRTEVPLVLCLALALAAHLWLNLAWSEPEGRFLLPAFVPIVYGFTIGMWRLVERTRWEMLGAMELLALALLPLVSLVGA